MSLSSFKSFVTEVVCEPLIGNGGDGPTFYGGECTSSAPTLFIIIIVIINVFIRTIDLWLGFAHSKQALESQDILLAREVNDSYYKATVLVEILDVKARGGNSLKSRHLK